MLIFCPEAIRIESNFYLILKQKKCIMSSASFSCTSVMTSSTIKLLWGILLAQKEFKCVTSVAFPLSGVLDRLSSLLTFQKPRVQEIGKPSSRETHVRWKGG